MRAPQSAAQMLQPLAAGIRRPGGLRDGFGQAALLRSELVGPDIRERGRPTHRRPLRRAGADRAWRHGGRVQGRRRTHRPYARAQARARKDGALAGASWQHVRTRIPHAARAADTRASSRFTSTASMRAGAYYTMELLDGQRLARARAAAVARRRASYLRDVASSLGSCTHGVCCIAI